MGDIHYFISYSYSAGMGDGVDNITLDLKRKIRDIDDIRRIEERISEITHHNTVKIINFQVFEGQNG